MEKLPEIYFTKLELQAELLEGEEKLRAANIQLGLSLDSAAGMAKLLAAYHETIGDTVKANAYESIAKSAADSARLLDSITTKI